MTAQAYLLRHGITSVYHFTDKSNLQTIEEHGLQSLKNIINLGIDVKHFGAEELSHRLDKSRGLDKYVHLAFVKDHPMYYIAKSRGNILDPVWIEIDAAVLYDSQTLFSDAVANQNRSNIFKLSSISRNIDLEVITEDGYLSSEEWRARKEARKAEIMVFDSIDYDLIKGVSYGK